MVQWYKGSCHCGFVKFEVLAKIDHLRACNCSICTKRGALNFRVPKDALTMLTSLSELTLYQWGGKTAEDYFCPKCGVLSFRKPSKLTKAEIAAGKTPFTGWAVNARCIDGLDLGTFNIVNIDGASL
jgi:hypothetical protein